MSSLPLPPLSDLLLPLTALNGTGARSRYVTHHRNVLSVSHREHADCYHPI